MRKTPSPSGKQDCTGGIPTCLAEQQPVFYAFFPLACFVSDNSTGDKNDSVAASQELELTAQFESPGTKVELSGLNFSRWISLQGLCARLSKSDSRKSHIYLDNCSLGRHGAVVIARSFTHVFIRGGNYHAQWLPLMYQNSSIQVLSVVNNGIGPDGVAAFAAMLRVNSGLRELNLNSNGIRCDGLQYLSSALFVNDTLRFLSISNNEICGIDESGDGEYDSSGLMSLVRVLHENNSLRTLKIAENDIKDYGAGLFADVIVANTGLKALDISGNNLFHDLEMSFGQGFALKRNPIILKNQERRSTTTPSPALDAARGNSFSGDNKNPGTSSQGNPALFMPASPGRKDKDKSKINAGKNDEDTEINPFASELLAAERTEPVVEEFGHSEPIRMTPLSLRGVGGRKFVEALGASCTLSHIDLSFNDMGPKGASLLAASIAKCKTVYYLELKGNPIMSEGAIAIADMMKENRTIRILGLERTGICSRGITYFSDVLATYDGLRKLNISLNDIGDSGAAKLTLALKRNCWLKYLYLHRCNLGSDGISYISSMLQVNSCIRHIGLSCNDIDENGMLALSATMLLNRSVVSLDISETRLRCKQGKVSDIGSEGWSALASMLRVNTHLNILNISGYEIPNESLEELLDAMNARRVCLLKADFRNLKWKYDAIIQSIDAERSLLASSVTCSYSRLHVCGESGIGKTSAVRRWLRLDSISASTPIFGSDFFGLGMFSTPIASIPPTIGVSVHHANLDKLPVVVWDYGGIKQFQVTNHLNLGDGACGRFLICVSAVWGEGKCRSYIHVADEITSWVRLIMTLGHKETDIAIVFLRGKAFDDAWKGKDPVSCGISPSDSRNGRKTALDFNKHGSFADVQRHHVKADVWSSLQVINSSRKESAIDMDDSNVYDKPNAGSPTHSHSDMKLRKHRMELQERELIVSGFDVSRRPSLPGHPAPPIDSSVKNHGEDSDSSMSDISLTSSLHTMMQRASPQIIANAASLNNIPKDLQDISDQGQESLITVSQSEIPSKRFSSDEEDDDRSSGKDRLAPSEEPIGCYDGSYNSAKVMKERRRYFVEAVQERMAAVLKWNRIPPVFVWDEGNGSGIPDSLRDWVFVHRLTEPSEYRVPKLCEILLDTCIQSLKASGEKLVSFDQLLQQARLHIRSLMPDELRVSLNWLHRTGYIYVLDGESDLFVSSSPPVPNDKQRSGSSAPPSEAMLPLHAFLESESTIAPHVIENSPLRTLGKFPLMRAKVILDISWFFGSVIGCIHSPRNILHPSIQHQLPWGDKDYLLSFRQLTALCESPMGPIQNKMKTEELICMAENMLIGAWCSSGYLFVPSRLSGDKSEWLLQRQISRMTLSQVGSNSGLPLVSAVIGRRINARTPFLLPTGLFNVLQCLLLQQYERSEWAGMSITCWEGGIGIVANLPKKSSKIVDPASATTVCALIEQTPVMKEIGAVDGMKAAGVETSGIIDVIIWGDGSNCPLSAVQLLLRRCIRSVEQAVLVVLGWPAKPERYLVETQDSENFELESKKSPASLFRTGTLSEDDEKFINGLLRVELLRPGCVLQTLALTPQHRECAVYEDESIAGVGLATGSPFQGGQGDGQLPVFVCCDHLQPRLCKHHLVNGYVLADTPGGGRAVLRAVSGALERTLDTASSSVGDALHVIAKTGTSESPNIFDDYAEENCDSSQLRLHESMAPSKLEEILMNQDVEVDINNLLEARLTANVTPSKSDDEEAIHQSPKSDISKSYSSKSSEVGSRTDDKIWKKCNTEQTE